MRKILKNPYSYYAPVLCILATILAAGCKKPFTPLVPASNTNILLVEGFINPGSDSTYIKLSRTVKLTEKTSSKPELGAIITVEGGSTSYTLNSKGNGVYAAQGLSLDKTRKYNIKITTTDGEVYASDPAEVKITPPIDSLYGTATSTGLQISVNTHDKTNSTRYYRWDYDEAWKFHAKHISRFKVVNREVIFRADSEQVYFCFNNDLSASIILGSTANLSNDIVTNAPIVKIAPTSDKIMIRYSILLRQHALTKEEYAFWQDLKKNSEQLGSIFDALPSTTIGNLHNTLHPTMPVIGFVGVSTVQSKRIFVNKPELANYFAVYPAECDADPIPTLFTNPVTAQKEVDDFIRPGMAAVLDDIQGVGGVIGYTRTAIPCADCTVKGYTKQPAFWTDK